MSNTSKLSRQTMKKLGVQIKIICLLDNLATPLQLTLFFLEPHLRVKAFGSYTVCHRRWIETIGRIR
jgi:hypothetical protein